MKHLLLILILLSLCACEKDYDVISAKALSQLVIQDTLVQNDTYVAMLAGTSSTDNYPNLLIKKKHLYKFNYKCKLENDSIIRSYYSAFIIDSDGEFRKNGIWVYTEFYKEGQFPFNTKGMRYTVDSIPQGWSKDRPTKEGIYFYENEDLKLISTEQSQEKFEETRKNGFYFIPNKGRLFDNININDLD